MSQIAKTLISGFIAASFGTAPSAQEATSDLLTNMLKGAQTSANSAAAGSSDPLREIIRQRVMDLASGSHTAIDPSGVTIKEIDHLNRSAERTKTQLELEKLEMQRTQTEIESLLMLYEALGKLEEKNKPGSGPDAPVEQKAPPVIATLSPQEEEMAKLPTLHGVTGAGGVFTAEIITIDGTTMTASKDSVLPDGFYLEDVTAGSITVRGSTDTSYRLMPKKRSEPAPQQGQDGQSQAIDMQGMPFGIF